MVFTSRVRARAEPRKIEIATPPHGNRLSEVKPCATAVEPRDEMDPRSFAFLAVAFPLWSVAYDRKSPIALVAYDRQSVAVSTIRSRRCIIRIPNCSVQHDPRSLIGYAVETDNGDDDREVCCFSSAQPPSSPPPPTSKRFTTDNELLSAIENDQRKNEELQQVVNQEQWIQIQWNLFKYIQ
ncbi:uncharacterized protein LOC112692798 [Sipha flava]|uniref:Uncharacterized protein LOC112692798 n=1 Tax=Sipha flava TaxID=143950 RepID=A0A2S2QT94_9HEMI|nr:uncharacterized protein LOC112692798 [Sipha flava]